MLNKAIDALIGSGNKPLNFGYNPDHRTMSPNFVALFLSGKVIYSRLWNKRSPWNNRSPPPLKNFHIMILILFYTNLGIAIIFDFFLSSKFFKN